MEMLEDLLAKTKDEIDRDFGISFFSPANSLESTTEAMHYMLNLGAGGKRLRPAIVMAVVNGFEGNRAKGMQFARAVEYLHTYTLILDDIQDESSLRRGMPACHVRFGVNTAMLAAGRLYERGLRPFHQYDIDTSLFETLCDRLHMGQAADLNVAGWPQEMMTLESLQFIHSGKTASLIQMAALGGCFSSGLDSRQTGHLLEYGHYIGLAFQAQDDALCLASDSESLGKPAGSLVDRNKLTYTFFYEDRDFISDEVRKLACKAKEQLGVFNRSQVELLVQLADHIIQRGK